MQRNILKKILWFLTKVAIRKHKIKFIVISGWYGVDLVKEGTYEILSEHSNVRRNNNKITSDVSVPLNILGYKDKKYSTLGWIGILIKASYSILWYKSNPHTFILGLNLAQKSISEYWYSLVRPSLLVVTSYKPHKSELITGLIQKAQKIDGHILVSGTVGAEELKSYDKFRFTLDKENPIITTKENSYPVNKELSPLLTETYTPIVAILEHYNWTKEEIIDAIAKTDSTNELLRGIIRKVEQPDG